MKNKEISIDVFSILTSAGWFLTLANIAGITQLPWANICTYWVTLLGIGIVMGILTALINMWTNKGGDK
jgi:hypothetical protein